MWPPSSASVTATAPTEPSRHPQMLAHAWPSLRSLHLCLPRARQPHFSKELSTLAVSHSSLNLLQSGFQSLSSIHTALVKVSSCVTVQRNTYSPFGPHCTEFSGIFMNVGHLFSLGVISSLPASFFLLFKDIFSYSWYPWLQTPGKAVWVAKSVASTAPLLTNWPQSSLSTFRCLSFLNYNVVQKCFCLFVFWY